MRLLTLVLLVAAAAAAAPLRTGGAQHRRHRHDLHPRTGAPTAAPQAPPVSAVFGAPVGSPGHPSVANCTERWATQPLDHFTWTAGTWRQRYFVYDRWFAGRGRGAPIFFYVGNEGPVDLYANWTGLMWDNGAAFGALLVFAEHRFFGQSLPCAGGWRECGQHLGTQQAMADYAALIAQLQAEYGAAATVVFGGSYGGMLAAYMRLKYPGLVAGAIASSAPIRSTGPNWPAEQGHAYWAVVSKDATAAGGSAPACNGNVHSAVAAALRMVQAGQGAAVAKALRLCAPPKSANELGLFLQAAFDAMAMGDYPFPTNYIGGTPSHPAPAWPMRVACGAMARRAATPIGELEALHAAVSVMDNITGDARCYNTSGLNPAVYSPEWDFMVCTEGVPNEQPYFPAMGEPNDMFYRQPVLSHRDVTDHCRRAFGVTPRFGAFDVELGARQFEEGARTGGVSNIFFANGAYDPWHAGGMLQSLSPTVEAYMIAEAGHHLDLFFATPTDSASLRECRGRQLASIRKWIAAASE